MEDEAMSKNKVRQYDIIRVYNNHYGLEVLLRRIIRHHINTMDAADRVQEYFAYEENEYATEKNV